MIGNGAKAVVGDAMWAVVVGIGLDAIVFKLNQGTGSGLSREENLGSSLITAHF